MTATSPNLPLLVGTLPKNSREHFRCQLTEFRNYRLLDLRVFAGDDDGAVPTKAGLSVRLEHLPALIALLQKAETRARALGLIDEGAQ